MSYGKDFDFYTCYRAAFASAILSLVGVTVVLSTAALVDIKWTNSAEKEVAYYPVAKRPVSFESTNPLYGSCKVTDLGQREYACADASFYRELGASHNLLVIILPVGAIVIAALSIFIKTAYPTWANVDKVVLVLRTFIVAVSLLGGIYSLLTIQDWAKFTTACGAKSLAATEGFDATGLSHKWRYIDMALFMGGGLLFTFFTLGGSSKTPAFAVGYFALVAVSTTFSGLGHQWGERSTPSATAPNNAGWYVAATCTNPANVDLYTAQYMNKTFIKNARYGGYGAVICNALSALPLAYTMAVGGRASVTGAILSAGAVVAVYYFKGQFMLVWNEGAKFTSDPTKGVLLRDTQAVYDSFDWFLEPLVYTQVLLASLLAIWQTYYRQPQNGKKKLY